MPTNTYVALDKITLASNGGAVTFTNIPQTYTDLRVVIQGGFVDSGFLIGARVGNSSADSGTNYSYTTIRGNGSSATSYRKSNMVFGALCQQGGNNLNNVITVDFMNYSNTTTYKTWISRYGNAGEGTDAVVSLWRSTAAINTISIAECGDGGSGAFNYGNMLAGTTFSLYGIVAASATSPKATGGTIYSDEDYYYHAFGSSGTFTPNQSLTCDYLVVAGGGGGGKHQGGGGGAGGLRSTVSATGGGGSLETALSLSASPYTVTIGSGGAGTSTSNTAGLQGTNSVFSTITSTGGGGGGYYNTNTATSGGSGGGASGGQTAKTPGTETANQGFAGGVGNTDGSGSGGGGGGAGAIGGTVINGISAGNGGNGVAIIMQGDLTYYAGGGGGGRQHNGSGGGFGGLGGGGTGAQGDNQTAGSGTANTGGGGGGETQSNGTSGNGGSGIVIVRYLKA
jgi:hypothetical protein